MRFNNNNHAMYKIYTARTTNTLVIDMCEQRERERMERGTEKG